MLMQLLDRLDPVLALVEALSGRSAELRMLGLMGPLDFVTAFNSNTAAAITRPEIPGLGLIERPELVSLTSGVGSAPTLLVGGGGAGKSGLVALLVQQLQATSGTVLLIDAGTLPESATTPAGVGASLVEPLSIPDAVRAVAAERHVTFIVDQLDTVAGSDRGKALVQLLRAIRNIPNVDVLAVSRTFQADRVPEISDLGFDRFDADELSEVRAKEALNGLNLASAPPALVRLARNLLDLSLIGSLVRKGINVLHIEGEVELWSAYRQSVESENLTALPRAVELAWLAAAKGTQIVAPAEVTHDAGLDALLSRGVVDATPARYRMRHERIRDYLVAWDATRHADPLAEVIPRLPREALLGVLRWMLVLLHASDADAEREFVTRVLGNNALTFETRAVVLEGLKQQTDPHPAVAAELVPHLEHAGHARLFYAGLGPEWLLPLAQGGAFATTPPANANFWEPLDYLSTQATAQPSQVAQILQSAKVGSPWIVGEFIDIALKLPIALAAGVADAVAAAIPEARLRHLHTSRSAAKLTAELATAGYPRPALALTKALLEPFEAGTNSLTQKPEARTPLDVHEGREFLRAALRALCSADSEKTRELFESLLRKQLDIEQDDGYTSYVTRPAIEDDSEMNQFGGEEGVLIVGLRDSAEQYCSDQPQQACQLIESYIHDENWLFRRLGVHLLRLSSVNCSELLQTVLANGEVLEANPIYHEVYRLLENNFGDLSEDVRSAYFGWVEAKTSEAELEKYPEDEREYRRLGITRKLLWPVRSHLSGELRQRLNDIVKEHGEPQLQGFLSGPYQPLVPDDTSGLEDQIRNLSIDDLVEWLRPYRPSGSSVFDPDNTARAFGAVVRDNPELYAEHAARFCDGALHPSLVSELLRALAEAVRSNKPLPWSGLLAGCQLVASAAVTDVSGNPVADSQAWLDAKRDVIDLLDRGIRAEDHAQIPAENEVVTRDLLVALLTHPDPGPDREQEHDPLDVAINSARGRALEALILYAVRRAARLDFPVGHRLEPEVRAALEDHVDPELDASPAVHSMFGWCYGWLIGLDRAWVRSHEQSIFPSGPLLDAFWRAAWSSYVLNTPLYNDVYSDLDAHYRRAIASLATPALDEGRYLRDARGRLVQRVLLAYIEGWEEIDDEHGRLALLTKSAPEDMLAVAFGFVGGELGRRAVAADSDVWLRARAYWERRLAYHEAHGVSTGELTSIWRWLRGIPCALPDVVDLLARTIAHATLGWEADQTVEFLAAQAPAHPREAARLLSVLQANVGLELRGIFHRSETETVLTHALNSGDPEAIESARSFINNLADGGDTRFYHLLQQHNS